MSVTPEFGWPLIEPTDFVTNLPADFELFADAVDDDLKGLKGGATGEILIKDSATDLDFSWGAVPAPTPTFTGCMIFTDADQNISNSVVTAVAFAAADYLDTDGFHDPSTNNTRITIPAGKGGKYLVFGDAMFADFPATPAIGRVIFRVNGTSFSEMRFVSENRQTWREQTIMTLTAGDYVEMFVLWTQTAGTVPLWGTTALSGTRGTKFGVQFLGA
jgi:hypothetical protein